jgi:argininosuccinate lyase
MLSGLTVNVAAMRAAATEGYATATDLADYLVRKGLAFREAHEAVARAVRAAAEHGKDLAALTLEQLRAISPLIDPDASQVLSLEGSLAARDHLGGTAPRQVRDAIARARTELGM